MFGILSRRAPAWRGLLVRDGVPARALSTCSQPLAMDTSPGLHSGLGYVLPVAYAAASLWMRGAATWRAPLVGWAEGLESALLLMTGLSKASGKNKRMLKPANHGKRPCNHTARRSKKPRRSHYNG